LLYVLHVYLLLVRKTHLAVCKTSVPASSTTRPILPATAIDTLMMMPDKMRSSLQLCMDLGKNKNPPELVARILTVATTYQEWKQIYKYLIVQQRQKHLLKQLMEGVAGVFEIPTPELLRVLCPLLQHLQRLYETTHVVSVGAGRALMESCIASHGVNVIATSENISDRVGLTKGESHQDNPTWAATTQKPFMPVQKLSAKKSKARVVYVSWVHPSFEEELLCNTNMMALVLSGEITGSCFSDTFAASMKQRGFRQTTLRTKGFCWNDHCYVYTRGGKSVSHTTIFWKDTINRTISEELLLSPVNNDLLWSGGLVSEQELFAQNLVDIMFWKGAYSEKKIHAIFHQARNPVTCASAEIVAVIAELGISKQ
jgi:hypothetical protein